MFRIGLSTPCFPNEECFKSYNRAGIECMEISVDSANYEKLCFDELSKLSKKYNVEICSFHFPFMPFSELDISREDLADKSLEYLKGFIDKATEIGIYKFVIHASGEPIEEKDRACRMACAKKSLFTLAEYAKERGAIILVEDLPRTCLGRSISDMEELISAHPDLYVCFDTNHLLYDDNVELIRRLGNKIKSTHISDYDFVNERHWLPGEGKNDWQGIINALNEVGYDGVWLYEIDLGCPKTIIRPRSLTYEDFVLNAKELFEGKTPTTISTPKPNLGFWD